MTLNGERGFTLVEVVVVLAILGLTAVAVLPALQPWGPRDDAAAARSELVQLLRMARLTAVERGVSVTVTVDPSRRYYLVETAGDDEPLTLAQGSLALAPGVSLSSDRPRVRLVFHRDGAADPDSLGVHSAWGAARVSVSRWTGEPVAHDTAGLSE